MIDTTTRAVAALEAARAAIQAGDLAAAVAHAHVAQCFLLIAVSQSRTTRNRAQETPTP